MQNLAPRPESLQHHQVFPGPPSPPEKPAKPKNITFACNACRRRKSKCDGRTPCQQCSVRNLECEYAGRPGQTRMQALKTRVDLYDELFDKLKHSSAEEASVLFNRFRKDGASGDLEDILKETGPRQVRTQSSAPSTTQNNPSHSPESMAVSPASASSSKRHPHYNMPSPESATYNTTSSYPPASTLPAQATATSWDTARVQISRNLHAQLNPLKLIDDHPIDYSIYLALADILGHEPLPTAAITKRCINAYLVAAGHFLQVWDSQDIQTAFSNVYNYTESKPMKSKMDICLVAAVGAVGAFYIQSHDEKEYRDAGEVFYQVARSLLEHVIDNSREKGARTAACLTICNMFRKQICAISFCQLAISLARKEGLNLNYQRDAISNAQFQSGRRLWRTLMSQQSWLAETLSFVPTSWNEDLQTLDVVYEAEDASLTDLINGQLARLAILKASIVAETSTSRGVTTQGIESIMERLRAFYRQLPPQIELRRAYELSTEVRRSVYYCHIFYLGGIILVYRIIVDHMTRAQGNPDGLLAQHLSPSSLTTYIEEGLFACRMSCRVLKLLWSEDGVYRRCWLTIFAAYVTCLVLLHTIAQNQLESRMIAIQDDLDSAASCLTILEWCGEADEVALHFYTTLKPHYHSLLNSSHGRTRSAGGEGSSSDAMRSPVFPPYTVFQETAKLLSHPLDETLNVRQAASNHDCMNNGSTDTISHILEQLDLAYEDSQSDAKPPYHWATNRELPFRLANRFGVKPVMQLPPGAYGETSRAAEGLSTSSTQLQKDGLHVDVKPSLSIVEDDNGNRGVKRARFVA